jgi:Prefoldin subunit
MTESSNNANATTIQLDTMTLEQLDQLQQREENRLPLFTQRLAALRSAAARLSASAAAVTELYPKEENEKNPDDKAIENAATTTTTTTSTAEVESPLSTPSLPPLYKPVFVPLTESVYLPGQICTDAKSATLLVELGTGYFVEQDVARTVDFLDRKRTMVAANADNGTYIRMQCADGVALELTVRTVAGVESYGFCDKYGKRPPASILVGFVVAIAH